MEFKVGDKACYPGHGVGVIKAIETLDFDDIRQTMYVLKINFFRCKRGGTIFYNFQCLFDSNHSSFLLMGAQK